MYCTDPKRIKRSSKPRRCYWCGELIDGEHIAWACFEGGRADVTRVHVECNEAWRKGLEGPDSLYYQEEVGYGDHCRGCLCERGRCECEKGGA